MPDSTVSHPYGETVDVIINKKGKSFALIGYLTTAIINSIKKGYSSEVSMNDGDIFITLKCPPELIYVLRDQYQAIVPGYYSNKNHWNTIIVNKDVPHEELLKMIALSHDATSQ